MSSSKLDVLGKRIVPMIHDRWTTMQISVKENKKLTQVIMERYAIGKTLLLRFMREGKVSLKRAIGEEEKYKMVKPLQDCKVMEGDLIVMSECVLPLKAKPFTPGQLHKVTPSAAEMVKGLVIYKDERIIVLDKPAGLAMHGGPKQVRHLELLFSALTFDGEHAPLIVHRLDKETSGLLVLARDRATAQHLSQLFAENATDNRLEKVYWALCLGVPITTKGQVTTNLYRIADDRTTSFSDKRKDLLDEGQVAITNYRLMQVHRSATRKYSLLEVIPKTGRRHQIRVHLREQLGLPILGDYQYYRGQEPGNRLHLHCYRIRIADWFGPNKELNLKVSPPAHFIKTMTEVPLKINAVPKFAKKKAS